MSPLQPIGAELSSPQAGIKQTPWCHLSGPVASEPQRRPFLSSSAPLSLLASLITDARNLTPGSTHPPKASISHLPSHLPANVYTVLSTPPHYSLSQVYATCRCSPASLCSNGRSSRSPDLAQSQELSEMDDDTTAPSKVFLVQNFASPVFVMAPCFSRT